MAEFQMNLFIVAITNGQNNAKLAHHKVYYDLRTDPELETNYISKHRLSSIDAD